MCVKNASPPSKTHRATGQPPSQQPAGKKSRNGSLKKRVARALVPIVIGIVVFVGFTLILVRVLPLLDEALDQPKVPPSKYVKFQITSAYPTLTGNQYTISMTIKNIGTAADELDPTTVFLNGNLTSTYTADNVKVLFNGTSAALLLRPGDVANGTITMNSGTDFVSGMTVNVIVQTTSGNQYPKEITLP
jgi:hypothetical protein